MVIMPVRVEGPVQTSATTTTSNASAQSDGKGEAAPPPSELAAKTNPPPTTTMPAEPNSPPTPPATSTSKNTENGYNVEMLIDQTLTGIEELQEAVDGNVETLIGLRSRLKVLQREYKASTKEVEALKKTLKSLQSVKL